MNYAVIFGGGVGSRMQSPNLPKQFIEVNGQPVIVYTIKHFQEHQDIDGIVIVTLENYINYVKELVEKYNLTKVKIIVKGGATGQESIKCGLKALTEIANENDTVLIHDAVRPIIDAELISANIESVKNFGNAITVSEATETVLLLDEKEPSNEISKVLDRTFCFIGRAPQSFVLGDIINLHKKALDDKYETAVDSASLCAHYGVPLHYVRGTHFNIKLTTPKDLFLFEKYLSNKNQ